MLNPKAQLDDGQMEIWLFRGDGILNTIQYLVEAKFERHHDNPHVTQVNGREFIIETTPAFPCQTDGDKAGHTPFHCEVQPQALRLLVPDTAPTDLFSLPADPL
jgi:diacylglycerol kinase family enzyme